MSKFYTMIALIYLGWIWYPIANLSELYPNLHS